MLKILVAISVTTLLVIIVLYGLYIQVLENRINNLKKDIPITSNSEFKIVAYYVPKPFLKGEIRIVIECSKLGIQKEYYVKEGVFYFGKYVSPNITSPNENFQVGGISCMEDSLFKTLEEFKREFVY